MEQLPDVFAAADEAVRVAAAKLQISARLWRETVQTLDWIAERRGRAPAPAAVITSTSVCPIISWDESRHESR